MLNRQRIYRRWHRRLALVVSLQLLAWTVSGVYFAFVDIEHVRGNHHRTGPDVRNIDLSVLSISPQEAHAVEIVHRLPGELVIGIHDGRGFTWLTKNGEPVEPLSSEQVLALSVLKTNLGADTAEWIIDEAVGSEFRGRELPLWKVYSSTGKSTVAYFNPSSGKLVAVRNNEWRWWDFFWSLHIMDYDDREDIGTWFLKIFSVLALLTAFAGLFLFGATRKQKLH